MKSSIDVLASSKGRKVAILGDCFELGERRKTASLRSWRIF